MPRPLCRHCAKKPVARSRGLCWGCFYAPGVRDLYPPASKFGVRLPTDPEGDVPRPATPTDAPAGSLDKMRALRARVKAGTELHHPGDSKRLYHGPRLFTKRRQRTAEDDTGLEDVA